MSHMIRFQETLRRLTMIDEGFVEGQAGLGLGLAGAPSRPSPRPAWPSTKPSSIIVSRRKVSWNLTV